MEKSRVYVLRDRHRRVDRLYFSTTLLYNKELLDLFYEGVSGYYPDNVSGYIRNQKELVRGEFFICLDLADFVIGTNKITTKKVVRYYLENGRLPPRFNSHIKNPQRLESIVKTYVPYERVEQFDIDLERDQILNQPDLGRRYFDFVRQIFHFSDPNNRE